MLATKMCVFVRMRKRTRVKRQIFLSTTLNNDAEYIYETQSGFTRHWSDNSVVVESASSNKYLVNTEVTGPGAYEHGEGGLP